MKRDSQSVSVAIPGSKRALLAGAKLVARYDKEKLLRISVYVRRNPQHVAEAVSIPEVIGRQLPAKRKYITGKQFESIYGADPEELKKVEDWATKSGLKVKSSSVQHRRVIVEGRTADIEKSFGLKLNEYVAPETGRFRGRVGEVHVPSHLASIVQGVFGLDTRPVGRPRFRRSPAAPVDWLGKETRKNQAIAADVALQNKWPGTFFPTEVAGLYEYPANLDGSGQNIAVFAFNGGNAPDPRGGYKLSSLQTYFEKVLSGKTPVISDVVVQGPGNDPGPDTPASGNQGDATREVMLDLCVVGSVAPEANIFVYLRSLLPRAGLMR